LTSSGGSVCGAAVTAAVPRPQPDTIAATDPASTRQQINPFFISQNPVMIA
jgi:hypothetical protein